MPWGAGYKNIDIGRSDEVVITAPSLVVATSSELALKSKLMPPPPMTSQQPPRCTGTHGLLRLGPNASSGVQRGYRAAKAS
jgi:hypothetical protein